MSEQMRSEFEKLCSDLGYSGLSFRCFGESQGCEGCDDYEDDKTCELYTFFKASRAALCVELPKEVAAGRWAGDTGYFKDDVIEAIHAAGVKTK